ncbi:hypothetical protein C0992_009230 [Termitomyces sp. T32_za158]|nr:hypothetical protein C0992_009230 [Termitomyces sp. T32_za158]
MILFTICMRRPRSLTNLTSARSDSLDDQILTPRTPRSRSGRAEEVAYTEFEVQEFGGDANWRRQGRHHIAPLLSSSASDSLLAEQTTQGYQNRGYDYDSSGTGRRKEREERGKLQMRTLLSNFPLPFGILFAGFLLFLLYMSYYRPENLQHYFGIATENSTVSPITSTTLHNASTSNTDPDQIISYANYTTFPLKPEEYLIECAKLHKGYMSHGDYWQAHKMGVFDTSHPDRVGSEEVCASTITYMLDGKVGLLADLALLAQVAALAREVTLFFLLHLPCN